MKNCIACKNMHRDCRYDYVCKHLNVIMTREEATKIKNCKKFCKKKRGI